MKRVIGLVAVAVLGCSNGDDGLPVGTALTIPPETPQNVEVTNCRLMWDAVPGAEFYKVYFGSAPDQYIDWEEVRGATSLVIHNPKWHTLFIAVTAVTGTTESEFSDEVSVGNYCP